MNAVFYWYKKLECMPGGVQNFKDESKVEITLRRAIFEGESVPIYYKQAPGNYRNDPYVKKLSLTSVVVVSCHFHCFGLQSSKMLSKIDHKATSQIPHSHPRVHEGNGQRLWSAN